MDQLQYIPPEYHQVYRRIVDGVAQIAPLISDEGLQELYRELSVRGIDIRDPRVIVLEQGESGLRERFFRTNRVDGRLDLNPPGASVTGLLQSVALAVNEPGFEQVIRRVAEAATFVVIAELSLSGLSLAGEISDLKKLGTLFSGREVSVISLLLHGTASAKNRCPAGDVILYREISNEYSARRWNDHELPELLSWFAEECCVEGEILWRMADRMGDREILKWGVGGEGWLITTDVNTPNNSLPILWYTPANRSYRPPFPRVSSRLYGDVPWNYRDQYWGLIQRRFG